MTHTVTLASLKRTFYIEEKEETLDVRISHLTKGILLFNFSLPKPAEGSLKDHALGEAYFTLGADYHERSVQKKALTWFKLAAYKGHEGAAFIAGGEAVRYGNTDEAASFFSFANSIPEASFILALQYQEGNGVPQDDQRAYTLMRRAAKEDFVPAQRVLGKYISKGIGTMPDDTKSAKWYKKAAKSGDREAQGYLGVRYHNGKGVSQSYEKALKWFLRAAHQGVPLMQYLVAEYKIKGRGGAQDDHETNQWLERAVAQGHIKAHYVLGLRIRDTDAARAHALFCQAAEGGNIGAQAQAGVGHFLAVGTVENKPEGVRFFRMGVAQGSRECEFRLGAALLLGDGVAEDQVQGTALVRRAAARRHQGALRILQVLGINTVAQMGNYLRNAGHEEDKLLLDFMETPNDLTDEQQQRAIASLQEKVDGGCHYSQNYLAICYLDGIGVARDQRRGIALLRQSAAQGNTDAGHNLALALQ